MNGGGGMWMEEVGCGWRRWDVDGRRWDVNGKRWDVDGRWWDVDKKRSAPSSHCNHHHHHHYHYHHHPHRRDERLSCLPGRQHASHYTPSTHVPHHTLPPPLQLRLSDHMSSYLSPQIHSAFSQLSAAPAERAD